ARAPSRTQRTTSSAMQCIRDRRQRRRWEATAFDIGGEQIPSRKIERERAFGGAVRILGPVGPGFQTGSNRRPDLNVNFASPRERKSASAPFAPIISRTQPYKIVLQRGKAQFGAQGGNNTQ